MSKRVVIIGGVAGGASAAARLRRLDESAEIIMVERDSYISFANCGLPYHIGGRIKERERLLVQTPEAMRNRFNIDVRVRHEAAAIHRDSKTVSIKDLDKGTTYALEYDCLVLSPGATAIKPRIQGLDGDDVFVLRNIPDTDMMRDYIERRRPSHATVIGGGFIGVEIAENLREKGLEVTLVEIADQVLGFLDYEMAALIHEELASKGIDLRLKDGIAKVERADSETFVVLASGARVKTEMIALGLGVRPDSRLAKEAGLETAANGAIIVDDQMRTSDPSILAVGDAVQIRHFVTGEPAHIPLAGPANKQGRIAADVICGLDSRYRGTQGTSVVKVFDLAAASTGMNEKTLKRMGREHHAIHIHPSSHAGYYPGSTPLALKLLFAPDGTILGAQGVGASGVDKRIDVIATAMRLGGKVSDLENLELAYAPPYSSAKDPVNMAGYVAGNVLAGRVNVAHWYEIEGLDREKTVVLDVREPVEREMGSIEGSINIPVDQLRGRLGELPRDKEIIVSCYVGLRAYYAARILMQNGFARVRNLSGGWRTYRAATARK